jgi:cobalamin biosynthesis protein CobD/CbiB
MKFLALLVALLLEQVRPVRNRNRLYQWFRLYAAGLQEKFDDGQFGHGVVAWLLGAAPLVLLGAAIYLALVVIAAPLAWAWSVVVLYVTMGFRQFSHFFTDMLKALNNDDPQTARRLLSEWSGESAAEFSSTEMARAAIEHGLLASHRFVFGAIAWFIVLGPAGAILYRASEMLAAQWRSRPGAEGDFGRFAVRMYSWIDWIPARATALTFAVVGNFEDAVYCWRGQAAAWSARTHGIILSAGAGALGIRLGGTLRQYGSVQFRPELGTGGDADVDAMESTVRLIWRSLVLWMFLVLIVSLAHALG